METYTARISNLTFPWISKLNKVPEYLVKSKYVHTLKKIETMLTDTFVESNFHSFASNQF